MITDLYTIGRLIKQKMVSNQKMYDDYTIQTKLLIARNKGLINFMRANGYHPICSGWEYAGWKDDKYYYWSYKVKKDIFNYIPYYYDYPNLITEYDDFYVISLLVKEDGI